MSEQTARGLVKRLLDLALSGTVLILATPVFATVSAAIKLNSPGPVFYRGRRVGRGGRPFFMLKFRTMVVNAEALGGSSTPRDDPRITRVGRLLRRWKLDELPQFINVFVGDMSIVGPRPQVDWAVALYDDSARRLLELRPGITDYASIRFANEGDLLAGSSDPDRDYLEKIAPEKTRLGLEYLRHHSLWIDIKIVAATIAAILGLDTSWVFPPASERQRTS